MEKPVNALATVQVAGWQITVFDTAEDVSDSEQLLAFDVWKLLNGAFEYTIAAPFECRSLSLLALAVNKTSTSHQKAQRNELAQSQKHSTPFLPMPRALARVDQKLRDALPLFGACVDENTIKYDGSENISQVQEPVKFLRLLYKSLVLDSSRTMLHESYQELV